MFPIVSASTAQLLFPTFILTKLSGEGLLAGKFDQPIYSAAAGTGQIITPGAASSRFNLLISYGPGPTGTPASIIRMAGTTLNTVKAERRDPRCNVPTRLSSHGRFHASAPAGIMVTQPNSSGRAHGIPIIDLLFEPTGVFPKWGISLNKRELPPGHGCLIDPLASFPGFAGPEDVSACPATSRPAAALPFGHLAGIAPRDRRALVHVPDAGAPPPVIRSGQDRARFSR